MLLNTEVNIGSAGIEIFIFVFACLVMLADLFLPKSYRTQLHWSVIAALAVAAAAAFAQTTAAPAFALHGFYVITPHAAALKGIMLLAAAGSLAFARTTLHKHRMLIGEFHILALLSVLGMLVIASAAHFLTLYLGLELMSLCLYALIAMRRGNIAASEAAIKYFVLGALASGLFLFGVSLIYGATGALGIYSVATVAANITPADSNYLLLVVGLVFTLAGMSFKMGVAPFHMWLPDVYHGASAPTTLFISAAPKVAALALLLRVLADGLPALFDDWQEMLMVMAVASLLVGNITAIAQTNLKRMLAYSAIAHSGFVLLALFVGGALGASAVTFYIAAYALMSVGGFGVVSLLAQRHRENAELADLRGMAARNKPIAAAVLTLMLSLAGIPPTVGFVAKLTVLEAVVQVGAVWLAVFAVLLSLVGAFYYLRVIWLMFFEDAQENAAPIILPPRAVACLFIVIVLVIGAGIFPNPLLTFFDSTIAASHLAPQ